MMRFEAIKDTPRHQIDNCQAWHGDSEEVRVHHKCAPGRILAMVSMTEPKQMKKVEDEVFAIVETCEFQHRKSSLFTTEWTAASMCLQTNTGKQQRRVQRLELVNPSHFVGHCLMVPKDGKKKTHHQLWCPELWADEHHKDQVVQNAMRKSNNCL